MYKCDNSLPAVPQPSIPKNGASHPSIRLVITAESSKVCKRSRGKIWLNKEYRQNVRNYIQPVAEIIHLGIWTQDVFGIQHLPGFQPLWVVRVDGQVRGCTHLFVYLLGPNPHVCKGPTPVTGPVIKVAPAMQLDWSKTLSRWCKSGCRQSGLTAVYDIWFVVGPISDSSGDIPSTPNVSKTARCRRSGP